MARTLLVTSEPIDAIEAAVFDACGPSAAGLSLNGEVQDSTFPAGWTTLAANDLVDPADLRRRFLAFLDDWPRVNVGAGKSFAETFTVDGRHSLWWTSVGADRQATHGIFKYFRYAALIDGAIQRQTPRVLVLFSHDPALSALVRSRAERSALELRTFPVASGSVRSHAGISRRWVWDTVRGGLGTVLTNLRHAARLRGALRRSRFFRRSSAPLIVFASRYNRFLAVRNGALTADHWHEIVEAVKAANPEVCHAYLPWKLAWSDLGQLIDADRRAAIAGSSGTPLLLRERFVPLRGLLASVGRQALAAWRLRRLVRRDEFRRAQCFAGTDMSPVLLPEVKDAVAGIVSWSYKHAQFRAALRAAGNVRAVVLAEEMYRPSMPILAAARSLGIPTVGVQHGTLMPAHLVYTLPAGHARHAPIPDYFAVYGHYARDTVSIHGAYPAERVWITGAARLDPLVRTPLDRQAARAALNLPPDRRVVVLATQTFPWFPLAMRAVLECMREHPTAVLCVKKHPSRRAMTLDAVAQFAARIGAPDVRGFEGDMDLLLAASDVWISASSTTILEAALMGKSTICVNFSGEPDGYPYVEDGASLPARSVEELRHSLACALSDGYSSDAEGRRLAFLRRHAGPTVTGRAAAVFAQKLLEAAEVASTSAGELPDVPADPLDVTHSQIAR
jgi:surface carbohydrate biosynthesis protein (TIGR04326 family)